MINYLNVLNEKFTRDLELGFDSDKCSTDAIYDMQKKDWSFFDEDTKWTDIEIDISDIPPTVFFMFVVNTYSIGFDLFIPLDMHISKFSKLVTKEFSSCTEHKIISEFYFGQNNIDIDYLNKTGKIKSTRQWNYNLYKHGSIWRFEFGAINTIQSIVEKCRHFMRLQVLIKS